MTGTDSQLFAHAANELQRAGLLDEGSDYDGMVGRAVLDLIKLFATQGHSGMSAMMTLQLFDELAHYRAITELTNDPSEWMDVADGMWQSRRQANAFSEDGGKTYYLVDNKNEVFKSKEYQN